MNAAFLSSRGVVKVGGGDARAFLNNLVTSDIAHVAPGVARFAALLTPQGKIIADFIVSQDAEENLLLDVPKALVAALISRLTLYRLRAKVTLEDISEKIGVVAIWDGSPPAGMAAADPRGDELGWRMIVATDGAQSAAGQTGATLVPESDYDAHRIACGVPQGGSDFAYNDAFPHESNMDRLSGVDFDKGCYIGQEVVSRMQHRGTARTRIVRVTFDGAAPAQGTVIAAGGKALGTMGASAGQQGLALMRIDRVAEAMEAGVMLDAGGVPLSLASADDLRLAPKAVSI